MGIIEIEPVRYEDGKLLFLDQTELPNREKYIEIRTKEEVFEAIRKLRVRGAPAIGVAAAYGLFVACRTASSSWPQGDMDRYGLLLRDAASYLNTARPTAVNLAYGLRRMVKSYEKGAPGTVAEANQLLQEEAAAIKREEVEACRLMGEYGLRLLKPGMGILTHCNAGTIATPRYGTCLAPIYLGEERGYRFHVYADETRPLLQGARLTSWELHRAGIDVTLICDNMANQVMKEGRIDAILVGADRIAANGDGANKIGTSALAVLAKEHGIPFYMFAPTSTIDKTLPSGKDIPIEQRDGEEIRSLWYREPMAPAGVRTYNPSFDVTEARYITAIITEKGVIRPPFDKHLRDYEL